MNEDQLAEIFRPVVRLICDLAEVLKRDHPEVWRRLAYPRGHHTPAEQYRPKSPVKANRRRRW